MLARLGNVAMLSVKDRSREDSPDSAFACYRATGVDNSNLTCITGRQVQAGTCESRARLAGTMRRGESVHYALFVNVLSVDTMIVHTSSSHDGTLAETDPRLVGGLVEDGKDALQEHLSG